MFVLFFCFFFFKKCLCLVYIRGLVVGVWSLASFFPCMCCVCWHWSLQMPHLDTFHLSVCCWWCPWWSLWSSFCLQAGTLQFHILYTLTSSDLRFSNDLSISMFFSWHYDVSLKGFLRSAKICKSQANVPVIFHGSFQPVMLVSVHGSYFRLIVWNLLIRFLPYFGRCSLLHFRTISYEDMGKPAGFSPFFAQLLLC